MVFDEEESKNDFGKTLVISIPYPKYLGYKEKPYYKFKDQNGLEVSKMLKDSKGKLETV